jgi:hypothetical protein
MKGQDEGDQDAHGNGQHQRDRGNDRSPSLFIMRQAPLVRACFGRGEVSLDQLIRWRCTDPLSWHGLTGSRT